MKMLKPGFKFEVVKNGIVGEVGEKCQVRNNEQTYNVLFYEGKIPCYYAEVFESTIVNNLGLGNYRALDN